MALSAQFHRKDKIFFSILSPFTIKLPYDFSTANKHRGYTMANGSACKIQPTPAANTFQGLQTAYQYVMRLQMSGNTEKTTGLLSRQRIVPASQKKNTGQRLRQTEEPTHCRIISLRSAATTISTTLRSGINFTYVEELCGSQPTNSV